MRSTRTLLGKDARNAILQGVNAVYDPVRRTLGPQGRNALLYRTFNRGSRITNDGHTIAQCQEPKDPFARLVAQAFKEVCAKTNALVGDGTTTTAVIAGSLHNDIHRMFSEGHSEFTSQKSQKKVAVMSLKKKILESATVVKEKIKESAKTVKTLEDLEKIAIVSVEDTELGKILAKMAWDVGIDGFIDTVEGYKGEIETEIIKGFRFPAKVPAKAFVNNPTRYEMLAIDCPVLITNSALDNVSEISGAFQKINNTTTSKIIVIAPSFSEAVLVNMVAAVKQGFFIFPVAVPSLRTEQFEDLATYCGAKFIDKSKGNSVRNAQPADLGFLEKLIVKDTEAKEDAVATGGKGTREETVDYFEEEDVEIKKKDKVVKEKKKILKHKISTAIEERIKVLKGQLKETQQDQFKKLLERRIASMSSAVGIIRVGDSTEASSLYRKLKIEDAVYACKSALRGGYVKGGGLCLKEIADSLPDDDILKSSLLSPYEQIQSSIEGGIEIGADIIDPMEAVFYAVEHATSVVSNLITVDIITIESEDPVNGEGEFAISRALNALVVSDRIHKGQLQESEREAELDRMSGLTVEEMVSLDNG